MTGTRALRAMAPRSDRTRPPRQAYDALRSRPPLQKAHRSRLSRLVAGGIVTHQGRDAVLRGGSVAWPQFVKSSIVVAAAR
jgi:hypothetical protein